MNSLTSRFMNKHHPAHPRTSVWFPWMLCLALLTGCSVESRDKWWRTLDPAGYKHSHSIVFNPRKYQRENPPEKSSDADVMALEMKR